MPAFMTGAGLAFNTVRTSEVYRAGIESIAHGQTEAARSLDLSPARTFTAIILPDHSAHYSGAGQLPGFIMKDVPILSVVSVLEMLNVAKIIGDRTFNYLIPLSMVGGLYLIMTLVASSAVRYLDTRLPKQGIPLR